MAKVFGQEIQSLPREYQGILLDDLAEAFENRFAVLSRAQMGIQFSVAEVKTLKLETK